MVDNKLVPYSTETEEALLGAILLDTSLSDNAIGKAKALVQPADFHDERHKLIYRAMLAIHKRGGPTDYSSVADVVARHNKLDGFDPDTYLVRLLAHATTSHWVEDDARQIHKLATLRRVIEAGSDVSQLGYKTEAELTDVLRQAVEVVQSVWETNVTTGPVHISQIVGEVFEDLEKAQTQRGMSGVPTGYRDIDRLLGGLQRSDLLIVAARPGMGKSGLLLGMADGALKAGHGVLLFSIEMSRKQFVQRYIAGETGVDQHRLRMGLIRDEETHLITRAMGQMETLPFHIDDTAGISLDALRDAARRQHAQSPLGLVIVDYIQLINAAQGGRNREQEVSSISRGLKELARELDVPVLAASQLSRAVESRNDKHPMLSDLRESGGLEQDADVVMFIYRDEYYNENTLKRGIAEVVIAKHRNGPTGTAKLYFVKEQAKFADIAYDGYREAA